MWWLFLFVVFFFQAEDGIRDVAVTGVQTCALPIFTNSVMAATSSDAQSQKQVAATEMLQDLVNKSSQAEARDRKSTRLNSSHGYSSYAVFCLKKKKKISLIKQILLLFVYELNRSGL